MTKRYTLDELIQMIDEPLRGLCRAVLDKEAGPYRDGPMAGIMATAPGSTNNHQSWPGGYLDHLTEVMNIAVVLYLALNHLRRLPFTLSDALVVLFLHDIEKPWRIALVDGVYKSVIPKRDSYAFQRRKLTEYGFDPYLTDAHINGLKYVEGEKDEYTQGARVMNELAAFCHLCDVTSARIWYAHPQAEDTWA